MAAKKTGKVFPLTKKQLAGKARGVAVKRDAAKGGKAGAGGGGSG